MALSAIVEKCISLDPEDRYGDLRALLPDLKALLKAFRSGTDAMDFVVGHIDRVSRFCPVRSLLERDSQDQILRNQFAELEATGQTKSLCCYGESGTGKSKQMESWVSDRIKERSARKRDFLVAWAKMDQHQVRPLVGIVQVFESMLQAVFSDPHENVTVWKSLILDALPGLGSMFLTLLSPHWQNLLLGKAVIDIDAVDWETYLQRFQTWARNLFGLFANARRPLILVIDDWQWCEASERALYVILSLARI
jgi:predicted ATPase